MVNTVLLLHGWAQNSSVFASRIDRLLRKLRNDGFECIVADAPHQLPALVDNDVSSRSNAQCWFYYNIDHPSDTTNSQEDTTEYIGLDESIAQIRTILDHQQRMGKHVAILGFSQGAVLAHVIAMTLLFGSHNVVTNNSDSTNWTCLKACIFYGGWPASSPSHSTFSHNEPQPQLTIPSMHFIGRNDHRVDSAKSEALARCFKNPTIIYHNKGHAVCQQSEHYESLASFLKRC